MAEYRLVERRFYSEKGITIVEKINKKNQHSYSEIIKGKRKPITQETHTIKSMEFFNRISELQPTPSRIKKKIEKVKEIDEYDEYEYFIGFEYVTPTVNTGQNKLYGVKGKHDFKTEYRITSPVKLNITEIKALIQSKFSDYSNVLKEDGYEIKEETQQTVRERPEIGVKQTTKITR